MNYECRLYQLSELTNSMRKNNVSISQFNIKYKHIVFDVIIDIGTSPYEIMVGAIGFQWACILYMRQGFAISMEYEDFLGLCDVLGLVPRGKEHFTSVSFLKYIAEHAPKQYNNEIVSPSKLMRFRQTKILPNDEPHKTVFIGWNDHIKDGKKAHNFNKTELFFGKTVADYCKKHNISSKWTTPEKAIFYNLRVRYPFGFDSL